MAQMKIQHKLFLGFLLVAVPIIIIRNDFKRNLDEEINRIQKIISTMSFK